MSFSSDPIESRFDLWERVDKKVFGPDQGWVWNKAFRFLRNLP